MGFQAVLLCCVIDTVHAMRRPTSATARQQPGPCATHVLHGGPQCVAPVVPARCPQRVAAVLVRDDRKQGSCGNFLPYDQPCPSSSGRTWYHVTDPGTARLLRVAALLAALVLLPMVRKTLCATV